MHPPETSNRAAWIGDTAALRGVLQNDLEFFDGSGDRGQGPPDRRYRSNRCLLSTPFRKCTRQRGGVKALGGLPAFLYSSRLPH